MATKTAKSEFQAQDNNGVAVTAAVEHLASLSQTALLGEADMVEMIEQWLQAKLDKKMSDANIERVEPQPWWEIDALSARSRVLLLILARWRRTRSSSWARAQPLLRWCNPNPFDIVIATPPTNARDFLTSFGSIPYHVSVNTGNKTAWTLAAGAGLNATQSGVLAPFGTTFFFNTFTFTPSTVGLHEMNITARIGNIGSAAPFGGYATWIYDYDADIFGDAPGWNVNVPVLFEVYS